MQKLCELFDYSVTSEIPHTKYQILVVLKYHILLQGLHFKEDTEKFGHNAFLKNEHKNYSRAEKIMWQWKAYKVLSKLKFRSDCLQFPRNYINWYCCLLGDLVTKSEEEKSEEEIRNSF